MSKLFQRSWGRSTLLNKPVNQRLPSYGQHTEGSKDGLFNAETIKRLNQYIRSGAHASVLDCGPFRAHNFRVLSEVGCSQVHYADLYATYGSDRVRGVSMVQSITDILQNNRLRFDFVLLWDIANYFSPEDIQAFFSVVSTHANTNCTVSFFLHTAKEMPEEPLSFILPESFDHLLINGWDEERTMPAPRPLRHDIETMCRPFVFDRSFLCKHAIQENIFIATAHDQ